jgi:hypothetical protein
MDRRSERRKRAAAARNAQAALGDRPLRSFPCGCREVLLTGVEWMRGRLGFRKGAGAAWAMRGFRICRQHEDAKRLPWEECRDLLASEGEERQP